MGAAGARAAVFTGSSLVNSLAGKSIGELKVLSNRAGNCLSLLYLTNNGNFYTYMVGFFQPKMGK